jgi:hypothetical protein
VATPPRRILEPPEGLGVGKFCLSGVDSGQANFTELWDCPLAAGGFFKNTINTNWCPNV